MKFRTHPHPLRTNPRQPLTSWRDVNAEHGRDLIMNHAAYYLSMSMEPRYANMLWWIRRYADTDVLQLIDDEIQNIPDSTVIEATAIHTDDEPHAASRRIGQLAFQTIDTALYNYIAQQGV